MGATGFEPVKDIAVIIRHFLCFQTRHFFLAKRRRLFVLIDVFIRGPRATTRCGRSRLAQAVLQLADRGANNQAAAFSVCIMAIVVLMLLVVRGILWLAGARGVTLIR